MNKPKTHSEVRILSDREDLEAVRVSQASKAFQISLREHKVVKVKLHLETFSMSLRRCLAERKVEEEEKLRQRDKTS